MGSRERAYLLVKELVNEVIGEVKVSVKAFGKPVDPDYVLLLAWSTLCHKLLEVMVEAHNVMREHYFDIMEDFKRGLKDALEEAG